jgi:hypothetical protein
MRRDQREPVMAVHSRSKPWKIEGCCLLTEISLRSVGCFRLLVDRFLPLRQVTIGRAPQDQGMPSLTRYEPQILDTMAMGPCSFGR